MRNFKYFVLYIAILIGLISSYIAGNADGYRHAMKEAFVKGYAVPVKHNNTIEYQWTDSNLLKDLPPN